MCEVVEQVAKCKAELQTNEKELEANSGNLSKALTAIEDTKEQVKSQQEKAENVIKRAFGELYEAIQKREKAILSECNRIAKAKETRLSMQQEGIQVLLDGINHCCSVSSVATSEYSDVQLLSVAQTILNRTTSLRERLADTPTSVCVGAGISARMNTASSLSAMVEEFGCVVDASPCGANTTAIIPQTRLGLKAEMKVTVISRDESGGPIDGGRVNCES